MQLPSRRVALEAPPANCTRIGASISPGWHGCKRVPVSRPLSQRLLEPLILLLPGVGCAMDEFQGSAVRIAEIRARTIDATALAISLEEDLDAIGPQVVDGRPIIVRSKHEGMVHPIGTFELPDDGWRPLDEQHAHAAGVEKSHALVRQGMQKFAADDLCVEAGASLGITDRYGEMRDSRELHHECLLVL